MTSLVCPSARRASRVRCRAPGARRRLHRSGTQLIRLPLLRAIETPPPLPLHKKSFGVKLKAATAIDSLGHLARRWCDERSLALCAQVGPSNETIEQERDGCHRLSPPIWRSSGLASSARRQCNFGHPPVCLGLKQVTPCLRLRASEQARSFGDNLLCPVLDRAANRTKSGRDTGQQQHLARARSWRNQYWPLEARSQGVATAARQSGQPASHSPRSSIQRASSATRSFAQAGRVRRPGPNRQTNLVKSNRSAALNSIWPASCSGANKQTSGQHERPGEPLVFVRR